MDKTLVFNQKTSKKIFFLGFVGSLSLNLYLWQLKTNNCRFIKNE